ncbi:HNH endonuclease signature motif containing protein [Micrococcus terreus]|uniref:HNH endonuclease signature motif containing protein n=1 Tax=Micrococcus terreus TaxID=574650 RepID=UPI00301597CD
MTAQLTDQQAPVALTAVPSPSAWSAADLSLQELLDQAQAALVELAHRLEGPEAVDQFRQLAVPEHPGADWGAHLPADHTDTAPTPPAVEPSGSPSLPEANQHVEQISRAVARVQMQLAGHADRAYTEQSIRPGLLGLPAGMTAFRSTADYLRQSLNIEMKAARTRLTRAGNLTEQPEALGQPATAPAYPVLAQTLVEREVAWASADHITAIIEKVRNLAEKGPADPELIETVLAEGEALLTEQARTLDPDSMRRVCARWARLAESLLNPDGEEPVDGDHDHRRGLFYQGQRHGLHRWLITADDLEHEVLKTVAEAAANPRARSPFDPVEDLFTAAEMDPDAAPTDPEDAAEVPTMPTDQRTLAQKQMNGLISALQGALCMTSGNGLPNTGGTRPQVMVHIDYQQLLGQVQASGPPGPPGTVSPPVQPELPGLPPPEQPGGTLTARRTGQAGGISQSTFVGPIHPTHIRALACDAEIIPVVFGGQGEVLDVGLADRYFTGPLRQAIIARDGGCTAPGCSIPAPWCEAHHVQEWIHDGPTSVDNGALLCSHHHHAVHAGAWSITMRYGRPWYTPAAWLDPYQTPQRNRVFRP